MTVLEKLPTRPLNMLVPQSDLEAMLAREIDERCHRNASCSGAPMR